MNQNIGKKDNPWYWYLTANKPKFSVFASSSIPYPIVNWNARKVIIENIKANLFFLILIEK